MRIAARLALATISGALFAAAFAPLGWSYLVFFGAFAFVAAVWRASLPIALVAGALGGAVFYALLLSWMSVVGTDAWIGVTAFLTVWFIAGAIGTAVVSTLPGAPFWVAAVWIAIEALRDRIPFGGFPWGRFGFATVGTGVDWSASIVGVAGLTGIVVLLASCAVWVIEQRSRGRVIACAAVVGSCIAVAVGGYLMTPASSGSTRIAVVQGSVPEYGMGAMDTRRQVLNNHLKQTLKLANTERVDGVIWPENASDIDPLADASTASALTSAARAVDAPILVGAVIIDPKDPKYRLNVGIVWTKDGPGQLYAKTHPVPFGEYIPFRAQLAGYTDRFDRIPMDFAAGERPGNLEFAGVNLGDVICFEIAYTDVVRDVVTNGAQVISVQTNNATYGATGQPAQQLAITRLAAIEHGRWVAVAATSGVSAFIDPHGTVVQQLTDNTAGFLLQDVPLSTGLTIADRISPYAEWLVTILAFGAVGYGLFARRSLRHLG